MSNTTDSIPDNARQWWLSNQGKPTGPHPEAYIVSGLRTGAISPQTYACAVGGQQWRRLSEWPEFSSAWSTPPIATPPPPPSPAQESGASAVAARTAATAAWSPEVIVWLGLLFSPIWAGIMAAVNARRLGMSLPVWRPVVIGLGATLLDMLISALLFDSLIVDLILYLGALGLIWRLDLMPQVEPYQARKAACGTQAHWLVPSLAGSPAAALVLFAFILAPLMPLEPREVCQRFVNVSSAKEAKRYTTARLWPALEALLAQDADPSFDEQFELTDEADAPAEIGGCVVGYRVYGRPKGEPAFLVEGFFHLKNFEGNWKIEDWYLCSFNNQKAPEPLSVAVDYQQLLPETPASTSDESKASVSRATTTVVARGGWGLTRWLFGQGAEKIARAESKALVSESNALARSGEKVLATQGKGLLRSLGKGIGILGAAILAGLAALAKGVLGGNRNPSCQTSSTSPSDPRASS